ncbi:MAG: nucleotide sugar dehydrogenase [Candidatus Zixiibacteriota bacterium]
MKKNQNAADELISKITQRRANVGVIGLGYVGLPLSVELAKKEFSVTGFDISESKVKLVNAGKSDIDDIKDSDVAGIVRSKHLKATTDPSLISNMDVVIICVPTPLSKTKDPDVSYILAAVEWVKKHLKNGTLVVLESTTYPGTTEDLILPMLSENNRKVGEDFFLAFSPERVDPGNARFSTKNTPRVVGGITPACTRVAKFFYEQTIPNVVPVSSTQAAEMVKLLENTFRSVNIGLVNEYALMCDKLNLNIWEIIDAASTKPFGFMPFYPGPGLGGHCIPIDPHYLSWKLKTVNYLARFIELAGDINSHMPEYVVDRIGALLNKNFSRSFSKSHILILGIAYKRDIKDVRESPALDVMRLLESKGAKVSFNDPHVPEITWNGGSQRSIKLTENALKEADLTVIITDHTDYDYQWIVDNAKAIFDTRNAAKNVKRGRQKIELL